MWRLRSAAFGARGFGTFFTGFTACFLVLMSGSDSAQIAAGTALPATFFAGVAGFLWVVLRGAGVLPAGSLAMRTSFPALLRLASPYAGLELQPMALRASSSPCFARSTA